MPFATQNASTMSLASQESVSLQKQVAQSSTRSRGFSFFSSRRRSHPKRQADKQKSTKPDDTVYDKLYKAYPNVVVNPRFT